MRQNFLRCHGIAMRKKIAERSKNQKSFPMHSHSKDCNFASKGYISTYSLYLNDGYPLTFWIIC